MRLITAAFFLLTLGGCLLYPWEEDLGADVDFSTSQSTSRVGETVTLTLQAESKEVEKNIGSEPDGLIYANQTPSRPFDSADNIESPTMVNSENVLQRLPATLQGDKYVVSFDLVGMRPGQATVRGTFVQGDGFFYPTLFGDHGEVTITVTE